MARLKDALTIVRGSLGAGQFIPNPIWTQAIANDYLTNLEGLVHLWKDKNNPRDRAFIVLMARKTQVVIHNVFWQAIFTKDAQSRPAEDIGEVHCQFHEWIQKLVELMRGCEIEMAPYYFH
ncbi:hypothetical protein SISNIDRAFT_279218 [Sistotremastrum niveocremeum HHB9708]|uniref:Uncharacterized protein n=1 Tax=Sistotremastrum niveocremeum HHB9708 TaxID=1314777 RepID=A0A164NQM4_9AGAM|nr:hypothetical protein SISNIDRAFT_279218 [Sistotremastrum niveocremeum HHB9708]